ncbi:phosphatase PAP2 family protein [Nitrosophilus alvini]|uniref:phosphatase PAP2 family protein n=1 Tax=Nitrosophilus alvini TaxID=2714855 RepID=UPI0019099AA8|nr:phosphatase PAP2 family protein [Nitrosophilus alvini]
MKKSDIVIFILFCFSVALFLYFAKIDLYISDFFYKEGTGFYLANTLFAKIIYKATIIVVAVFTIAVLGLLILDLILKKELFSIRKKVLVYLILSLLLGPGLVVNLIFKDNWGRARPIHIEQFGGDKKFTPAFVKTDQCEKNCSFSSGHAAAAFYFLSLVPLFRDPKKRFFVAAAALAWGFAVGTVRVLQGGHFLSDVVFSAFFVYFTARILYYFMFERGL